MESISQNTFNDEYSQKIQELEALARSLQVRLNERECSDNARQDRPPLPEEIWKELEQSSTTELEESFRIFKRDLSKYDSGNWTRSGAINKGFINDLKKATVEANQAIQAKYKEADRM